MNDGETLKAHKSVLVQHSPVFAMMLTHVTQEATNNSVQVTDFDSTTMKELLRFVHSSVVENLDSVAFDLVVAAEKYQIDKLKEICCRWIFDKLTDETIFEALFLATRLCDMDKMFKKCVDFIIL